MLLGAHVSVGGGLELAPARALEITGEVMQIFTRNQRTWNAKPLLKEESDAFRAAREEAGIGFTASHASYLLNPAAPDPENLRKSRDLFGKEVERCLALGLQALVLHPGAAKEAPREEALDRVAETLAPWLDRAAAGNLRIALENTAGQGTVLGADFAELGAMIERMDGHEALGVCFDTAHAWGAGYDLRGKGLKGVLRELEREVGPDRLVLFHLNDTPVELGSRKDRHAVIGEGNLGAEPFQELHRMRKHKTTPGILETPGGMEGWADELALIREG